MAPEAVGSSGVALDTEGTTTFVNEHGGGRPVRERGACVLMKDFRRQGVEIRMSVRNLDQMDDDDARRNGCWGEY